MLSGAQEEGAIDQRITIENVKGLLTQRAGNPRLLLTSQGRQDKEPRVVIAVVTLVFNLQQRKYI